MAVFNACQGVLGFVVLYGLNVVLSAATAGVKSLFEPNKIKIQFAKRRYVPSVSPLSSSI